MEIDLDNITKEESLNIINTLINKSGITKKEVNESYNNSTITNKDKKNVVRIRLMSQNEAILKLMVPYGNKQNVPSNYAYPWKISEGKYGIQHRITSNVHLWTINFNKNESRYVQAYNLYLENKINLFNNLYQYTYSGSNAIGLLSQNANWWFFSNQTDGYALCYQDNYEDKPEIRVNTDYIWTHRDRPNLQRGNSYYSKNGDAINAGGAIWAGGNGGNDFNCGYAQNYTTVYKSSNSQYNGFFPVLSVAS